MAGIAIIGAGIAGLAAGRELQRHGLRPTLFDRGRRPGGRCATRDEGAHAFDHGAQYFTARDPHFRAALKALEAAGAVAPWPARVVDYDAVAGRTRPRKPGLARYVGVPGMRAVADALGDGLNIHAGTPVTRLHCGDAGWTLLDEDGNALGDYDSVLLALPPEQARPLIPRRSPLARRVAALRSLPCWAVMAGFDAPLDLPFDAAHVHGGLVAWAARDAAKPGRARGERWVVHASDTWSAARLDASPDNVAEVLLAAFVEELRLAPVVPNQLSAHRWALARVERPADCDSLWDDALDLGLCGDWCVAPRIEGAWLSGVAAARRLLARHARASTS